MHLKLKTLLTQSIHSHWNLQNQTKKIHSGVKANIDWQLTVDPRKSLYI